MSTRLQLYFLSNRYLLPADQGGKIRTGHILRGLKGGRFEVTLLSPAPEGAAERDAAILAEFCDHFESWPEARRSRYYTYTRLAKIFLSQPVSVATLRSPVGEATVAAALARRPDLFVVDFTHSAVSIRAPLTVPSVLFTHNVEAEIFRRHLEVATNPIIRAVWRDQYRKMRRFEDDALHRFDTIITVSDRDGAQLEAEYGVRCEVIPTGVDLDALYFDPPDTGIVPDPAIVFTATMDSFANIEGMRWFMDTVWPLIALAHPRARVIVVGRNPDAKLVQAAAQRQLPWTFTGYVESIVPHVHEASVYVVPLRVGSGTRIKVFEAMALGRPVVSTSIGVEGLQLEPGRHYLLADTPQSFADAVVLLLKDGSLRAKVAHDARGLVEACYSYHKSAQVFEEICERTLSRSSAAREAADVVSR